MRNKYINETKDKIRYEVLDGDQWITPKFGREQPGGCLYYVFNYCDIGLARKGKWRIKAVEGNGRS